MVKKFSQAWWYTPINPAHKRSRWGISSLRPAWATLQDPGPKKEGGKEKDRGRREGRGERIEEKGGDREGLLLGAKF